MCRYAQKVNIQKPDEIKEKRKLGKYHCRRLFRAANAVRSCVLTEHAGLAAIITGDRSSKLIRSRKLATQMGCFSLVLVGGEIY